MKIAIVRGDYLSSWEISNSQYLIDKHDVTFFVGKYPVYQVNFPPKAKMISLWSPTDLNFGHVARWKMAILNRLFIDAHLMFGLEQKLKGFDVAYVSETFYGFTHQCLVAKKKGYLKRVVSHVSDNTPFNNESIWGKRTWKQQAIREMDKFVAITEGAKKVLLTEGCDPKKIIRSNPGVDLSLFKPTPVAQFRGLSKNQNTKLLFIGRLIKEKGIREILQMFTKLSKKFPKLELIIADRGPLANEVKEYAATHKKVTYLGRIDPYTDMPKLYSLCDIYLHYSIGSPTWVEQYGFNLIEAMACGLPVMGLDRGSVKEVVGPGGLVVGPKDFLSKLEGLIQHRDYRQKLGQTALTFARKNYDAYKHSQDLYEVFKSTL